MGICLDTTHLALAVDRHTSKRRIKPKLVGLVVRSIMGKFNIPDAGRKHQAFYDGETTLVQSDAEKKLVANIVSGDMPKREAEMVLKAMNPNVAMKDREEFTRLIAALVVIYPQRLDVKTDKTTLRKILVAASEPQRAEWYFNNIRYRSRLTASDEKFLGTGTFRNEQLHATLNAHFKETVQIQSRMLDAQLNVWLAAEMALFLRAMEANTTIKIKRVNLRPVVISGIELFSNVAWASHLKMPETRWTTGKALQRDPEQVRRGYGSAQEKIYKAIKAKTMKRKCETVYSALLQKKLRVA